MYWYLVQTSHDQFSAGGCGGGTTVLVLCIGIESRHHMTNTMVVVVVRAQRNMKCPRNIQS